MWPMDIRGHRSGPLVGALVLVAALGACGGGGDDESDDGGGADDGGEATGACALLTTDAVSDMFGETAEVVSGADEAARTSTCLWEATAGDGDFPTRHQLQLSVYEDSGALDPSAWGEEAEPIDDLGEEAFLVADGFLGPTAGYRDGDRSTVLTYAVVGGEDAPSAADRIDELVELLRAAEEHAS